MQNLSRYWHSDHLKEYSAQLFVYILTWMWLFFCFEFTNFVKILLWLLVWIFVVNLFRSSLISSTTDKKLICSKMLIILTMLCINLHAIQWISQFYLIKWNNLHWNWVDISQTFCPSIFPIISYFAYHPILYKLFPSIMPVFDFTSPNFVPKYPAMDGEIEFLFISSINQCKFHGKTKTYILLF